jgi:asparagine synthase (glutamine-hydrolysing)
MVASLHPRGPDGEGRHVEAEVALGMRRLAILDLPHGQQPFTSADGRIVAFCNGEIYNHRELRKELGQQGVRFSTECDAEVLPHAFRTWGAEELPRRLDGMFAIAILDRTARRLHLYRDRFGEKPLFYSAGRDRFCFASQLTSLTLDPDFDFTADPLALRHYLALHYVPGARTLFRDIRRLEPGHALCVELDAKGPPRITHWAERVQRVGRIPRHYPAAVEEVRERLSGAVRSRLIADVPIGIFLSGGLDSSALAGAAVAHDAHIRTFSVGFADATLDESAHAKTVARRLGTDHHHFDFDWTACLSVFDDAMESLDEPLGDPACLPVLLLSREARRHVKVVLSGEGADEVFGGYAYYPPVPIATEIEKRSLWRRLRGRWSARPAGGSPGECFFRPDNTTPSGFPTLTSSEERDRLVPGSPPDEDEWTRREMGWLASLDCDLRRAQRADIDSWLADDLLPKLDHMTMAVSLEGRAPYLDPKLADFGMALPAEWKAGESRPKRVLRDAAAAWLPTEILDRRKQGFVLPMQEWLLGPLRERLLDGLADDRGDGLDVAFARQLVCEDLDRGASRSRLLYGLLAYREWLAGVREGRACALRLAERGAPNGHA